MWIDAGAGSVEAARALVAGARHLVLFTGAGVSTESGLPDFRGPDGVWTREAQGRAPPRSPFAARPSPIGAHEHPARRLVFEESPWTQAEPNAAHLAIRDLDRARRLGFLVSQNVDNLHRKSGVDPRRLAELHGNPTIVRCVACWAHFEKESFRAEVLASPSFVPVCRSCGRALRSSVVDFGDAMPPAAMETSIANARAADVFVVIGSSLAVNPAAEMPLHALEAGARLVIVNLGPTEHDALAHVRVEGRAGEVLPRILS
jgi:NAD-dependent deacetylase